MPAHSYAGPARSLSAPTTIQTLHVPKVRPLANLPSAPGSPGAIQTWRRRFRFTAATNLPPAASSASPHLRLSKTPLRCSSQVRHHPRRTGRHPMVKVVGSPRRLVLPYPSSGSDRARDSAEAIAGRPKSRDDRSRWWAGNWLSMVESHCRVGRAATPTAHQDKCALVPIVR
jgi:hypothetical protein